VPVVGRIERVPLREIWKHEAIDFTRRLQENLEILNESLDITLSNAERERSAGDFSVDLVAEDEAGDPVVIENQLEKSNHDHLGKIITYLTAVEARTAVWIVSEARAEHIAAVTWLNESTAASFYLLKVEGVRIGESDPAPLLTLIVGPSEGSEQVGETKNRFSARHSLRLRFWKGLLAKAAEKTRLHAGLTPGHYGWLGTGAGKSGLSYNYSTRQHDSQVELYIDRGEGSDEANKRIFDRLLQSKDQIDKAFGHELNWERLDDRRASRISFKVLTGGYKDETKYAEIHSDLVDAMCRLESALKSHIQKLEV
jgi:hypothetical protein